LPHSSLNPEALEQLEDWKKSDSKILSKIISLLIGIAANPFTGTGNPGRTLNII